MSFAVASFSSAHSGGSMRKDRMKQHRFVDAPLVIPKVNVYDAWLTLFSPFNSSRNQKGTQTGDRRTVKEREKFRYIAF